MRNGSLPPGPRVSRLTQTVLWTYRMPEFIERGHRDCGDTFTLRAGTLPPAVLTRDRDAIRRLFTGDPLLKRHGHDFVRPLVGPDSHMILEPAAHLARRRL